MNQILTTKPVKAKKNVKIKTVKTFFGISIIIFGICMITSGSYAMYKNRSVSDNTNNTNMQTLTTEDSMPNSDAIQIHLSVEGANMHATLIGEKEISFVTYKWDEEEETKIEINSISDDIEIEIPGGEHKLTITAVDINNNSQTKKQRVKGVTRPTLEVVQNGSQFTITSSDEIGLDKVEFILNGKGYRCRVEGEKETEITFDLQEGENSLEVTTYNTEGETETFTDTFNN